MFSHLLNEPQSFSIFPHQRAASDGIGVGHYLSLHIPTIPRDRSHLLQQLRGLPPPPRTSAGPHGQGVGNPVRPPYILPDIVPLPPMGLAPDSPARPVPHPIQIHEGRVGVPEPLARVQGTGEGQPVHRQTGGVHSIGAGEDAVPPSGPFAGGHEDRVRDGVGDDSPRAHGTPEGLGLVSPTGSSEGGQDRVVSHDAHVEGGTVGLRRGGLLQQLQGHSPRGLLVPVRGGFLRSVSVQTSRAVPADLRRHRPVAGGDGRGVTHRVGRHAVVRVHESQHAEGGVVLSRPRQHGEEGAEGEDVGSRGRAGALSPPSPRPRDRRGGARDGGEEPTGSFVFRAVLRAEVEDGDGVPRPDGIGPGAGVDGDVHETDRNVHPLGRDPPIFPGIRQSYARGGRERVDGAGRAASAGQGANALLQIALRGRVRRRLLPSAGVGTAVSRGALTHAGR
mmetsp:Transcript_7989/g.17342  ORF Transcript_7989/g.17342 Transcript_7989/m.17342 type:complete len:448 (-) Transcript_7989:424-1767(-)